MTRLLTLTGSGGCGKSRLAVEVAGRLLNCYPDGVWLVELASLAEPGLVPQAIARVLSIHEQADETLLETVLNALSGKRLLIILDNCEHLIGACAQIIDATLRACPAIQVLATSREPVRIAGEAMWRVPSLAMPDPARLPALDQMAALGAVGLFVDRVQAAQPAFAITELQELEYKWGIFHALGGLAHVAAAQGQTIRARRLAGAAFALKDAIGASSGYLTEPDLASGRGSPPPGEQVLAEAWADGQRMTLEHAIAVGLLAAGERESRPAHGSARGA